MDWRMLQDNSITNAVNEGSIEAANGCSSWCFGWPWGVVRHLQWV